jgi:hypothetical protein
MFYPLSPPSHALVALFSPTAHQRESGREERKRFLARVVPQLKSGHICKLAWSVAWDSARRYFSRIDRNFAVCVVLLCLEVIIHGRRGMLAYV